MEVVIVLLVDVDFLKGLGVTKSTFELDVVNLLNAGFKLNKLLVEFVFILIGVCTLDWDSVGAGWTVGRVFSGDICGCVDVACFLTVLLFSSTFGFGVFAKVVCAS